LRICQHALVQDAAYQDAGQFAAKENDVAGLLRAQQAGTDVIARSTEHGRVGHALAVVVKEGEISVGLICAPGAHGVGSDIVEIRLGRREKRTLATR
jgi:hypothetical protein